MHCLYTSDIEAKTFVGAGDAFLGGFISTYDDPARGRSLEDALKTGVAASIARIAGTNIANGRIDLALFKALEVDVGLQVFRFKSHQLRDHLRTIEEEFRKYR